GEMIPATLPKKFCNPVHFPEACGPATVCVMAQRFDVHRPTPTQVRKRNTIAMRSLVTKALTAVQVHDARANPEIVKVFRTTVGWPPAAIHRSAIHPPNMATNP